MRRLVIVLIAVVLSVVGFFGIVILASESGEVITLRTSDGSVQHSTRLWVVDHAGAEWTRTGHPEKAWFRRLLDNPAVELERRGKSSARTAVPVPEGAVVQGVKRAYKEKYGVADWIVALSGDASRRVVIRLDRTEP